MLLAKRSKGANAYKCNSIPLMMNRGTNLKETVHEKAVQEVHEEKGQGNAEQKGTTSNVMLL